MNSTCSTAKSCEEALEAWLQLLDAKGHDALAWLTHDVFRMGLERRRFRFSTPAGDALALAQGVSKWVAVLIGTSTLLLPLAVLILWSVGQSPADALIVWLSPIAAMGVFVRIRRGANSRWSWGLAAVLIAGVLSAGTTFGFPRNPAIIACGLAWAALWPWLVSWLGQAAAARTLRLRADHFNRAIALGKIRIERR